MNVTKFLDKQHCKYKRVTHRPTYSAQRLAHELHVPGGEVAKCVLLRTDGQFNFVIAVIPASKKIDIRKIPELVGGEKAELATEFDIACRCPDCDFGALPPFGSRFGLKTILDFSLTEDEYIWFESNTRDEAIRMKSVDFCQVERPLVARIAA